MTSCVLHTLFYIFKEKTGNIIKFAKFEEGNLLSKTHNNTVSNKKSDDSTLSPLINDEEMDAMSSGDESDAEPMSTDMLEDICYGSKYHPSINRRDARCKIHNCII